MSSNARAPRAPASRPAMVAALLGATTVLTTALTAAPATAQAWPSKAIRIVVSATPGGGVDTSSRIVGQGMTERWGQPVLIENRPGGGGAVAGDIVARSAPDGYTLKTISIGHSVLPSTHRNLSYDPERDLVPVSVMVNGPNVLVVHPSLPVKSVKELIALAKARPGELNYSAGTTAATPHLAMELFKYQSKLNFVRVNYRGTQPAVNALMAGEVQVMFTGAGSVLPMVKAGRLRAIAVTTAERSPLVPGLPTVAESGLPGYEFTSVVGVFVPAKTPPAIVNLLSREISAILKRPEVVDPLFESGTAALGSTPEAFDTRVRADIDRWRRIIKDTGIQIE